MSATAHSENSNFTVTSKQSGMTDLARQAQKEIEMDTMIYGSPESYGSETVYCTVEKITEVEDSLRDPAVFGDDFTAEDWNEFSLVGENVYTDKTNYARFIESDNAGYYERASSWTQYNPLEA